MAARRLILIMLTVLVVSTFVAALVPQRETGSEDSDPEPAAVPAAPVSDAKVLVRTLSAGKRGQVVRLEPGDRLELEVASEQVDLVSIPGLGLLEDVVPGVPARFDLLADERGTYAIRLVEAERTIGRLEVGTGQGGAGKSSESPGSSSAGTTSGASFES